MSRLIKISELEARGKDWLLNRDDALVPVAIPSGADKGNYQIPAKSLIGAGGGAGDIPIAGNI